jgi:dethiobiotin synthetase
VTGAGPTGSSSSGPPSGVRGVFVTGTGTGVGKTVVAAVIARELAARGERVAVFKPAVTGLAEEGEPDHLILRRAAGSRQSEDEIALYRYRPPVSPHLAAEQSGEAIEPARLLEAARRAASDTEAVVCEGVGGLMVPLTPGYLVRDLARELGLPLVIAAAPGLGTINHTLLTLEAARAFALEVATVVFTPWPQGPDPVSASNRQIVEELGRVRTAVLPALDPAEPESWPLLGAQSWLMDAPAARPRGADLRS